MAVIGEGRSWVAMRTGMLAFPLLGRLNHTSQVVYASESHFSVFFRKGKRTEEGGGERQGERERQSHRSSGSFLGLLSVDQGPVFSRA